MKLIDKILFEATFEKDQNVNKFVTSIIKEIKKRFSDYTGLDTNEFEYNEDGKTVISEHKIAGRNLTIIFYDKTSKNANINKGGVHIFPDNIIKIYGCYLDWEKGNEEIKSHWFDLNIEESVLYHELVHFYDYNFRKKNDFTLRKQPYNTSRSTDKEKSKYYNHGVEFNAYFLQNIMPIINKFKEQQLPKGYTFQKFTKDVLKDENANTYYQRLNKEMKRHFIKRLADYYQKIRNGINK